MAERAAFLDGGGPAAPPRANGELVFAAPWESRIFGIAVALQEQGLFTWDEFRDYLITEVAAWERAHAGAKRDRDWNYYARWQAALETLVARKGLCGRADLDARADTLAARPRGHDH
jgi:nitrile hydratase accessory protein